ncbi:MAG: sigma-B regulation protein RsbU (phosphoserine phosphatase) [Rhodothermales bacterium]|jgi:sigma-B regulation protein RsbU (phosphoserine phosphatase)
MVIDLVLLGLILALGVLHHKTLRVAHDALRSRTRALGDRDEIVNFLNSFTSSISGTQKPKAWMQAVATELALAIGVKVVRIFAVKEDSLELTAAAGDLPPEPDQRYRLTKANRLRNDIAIGEGKLAEVGETGETFLEPHVEQDGEHEQLESVLAVPVTIRGQVVGVICVANKVNDEALSTMDQFLLEALARQVALGLTLVEAHGDLSEQRRLQQELEVAREIQNSLLPEAPPEGEDIRIYGINVTCSEVSGDFYDYFDIDEDTILVLIADASGKGVPACMITSICRTFVRANAHRFHRNLEGMLRELNRNLFADTQGSKFVTVGCCLIDKRDHTIEYARAGHTELLVRQPRGQVQVICPDGDALGMLPDEMGLEFDTYSFVWRPGTSLLLFTDGITEALNTEEEEYGLTRLITNWQRQDLDPKAAAEAILEELADFTGDCPQGDDQTIVILSRTA